MNLGIDYENKGMKNDHKVINLKEYRALKADTIVKKHSGGATRGGASALRNEEDILNIMRYFFDHKNDNEHKSFGIRNYTLICFAFNCQLRGGDLLSLKLSNVIHPITFEIVDEFIIKEEKTSKTGTVFVNDVMKNALKLYLKTERQDYKNKLQEPLFLSRQIDEKTGELKAMSLRRYNQLFKEVKQYLNLDGKISTHSGRKSWARGIYDSAPNEEKQHVLVLISAMLNHSNIETTMIYLDIRKDELRSLANRRQIGLQI